MRKRYFIDRTIRGDFYRIELTKTFKNIPGFAPEEYDREIGTVTVKFRDDKPYFQTDGSGYTVLTKAEIKQILKLLERGYKKEDFKKEESNDQL